MNKNTTSFLLSHKVGKIIIKELYSDYQTYGTTFKNDTDEYRVYQNSDGNWIATRISDEASHISSNRDEAIKWCANYWSINK